MSPCFGPPLSQPRLIDYCIPSHHIQYLHCVALQAITRIGATGLHRTTIQAYNLAHWFDQTLQPLEPIEPHFQPCLDDLVLLFIQLSYARD
jgi:hypothetical protein